MIKRAITGLLLVSVLGVLIYFDQAIYGLFGVFLAFSLIAVYELISVFRKDDKKVYKYDLFLYILVFINFISFSNIFSLNIKTYSLVSLSIFLISNLSLFIMNTFNGQNVLKNKSYFIINYIPIGLSSIIFLRNIENIGLFLTIYLISTVFLTDTFAYIFGRFFGKHKLTKISPKKTWEGSIFGTLYSSISVLLISYFLFEKNLDIISANLGITTKIELFILLFFITVIISIIGQLGDLFASKIKRENNIKDYGKIFPGHGGVLDRFDSLIFASYILVSIIFLYSILWKT